MARAHSQKHYSGLQMFSIDDDPRYDRTGHAIAFVEPSRDDEDLSDVSDIETMSVDRMLRSTKHPAGFRRF